MFPLLLQFNGGACGNEENSLITEWAVVAVFFRLQKKNNNFLLELFFAFTYISLSPLVTKKKFTLSC
jgi:hypothetical protein